MREAISERWVINRIGLINFWYYDEEEFNFRDGRLLLRGSNGSGKSVTMQSFIPLLLDGNKSPERLDPFGSRARKLENYLIGEEDSSKDENTGYLFMEFKKPNIGNYMTIGMGLKAKRGKSLDFWGFCIIDGRRVGKDCFLYKDIGNKIPLSKIELKNRIGSGGQVLDSQGDYMAMVNELLFGFESMDEYDELIKLLVQLRTPKLSKDFKPTVIYEIMNNSLQPLSDEDLRPMSEAIENMDNIKSQLEVLQGSKKSAGRISVDADKYNRFVLMEKAKDVVDSALRLEDFENEEIGLEKSVEELINGKAKAEIDKEALESEQRGVEHKREELEKHDSFRAKQEAERLKLEISSIKEDRTKKENSLNEKKKKILDINSGIKDTQEKLDVHEKELKRLLDDMSSDADSLSFYDHDFFRAELETAITKEFDFKTIRKDVDLYKGKVVLGRKALEQEKSKNQEYDECLRLVELAKNEKLYARRNQEKHEMLFSEMKTECIERIHLWDKSNGYLKLGESELSEVARSVNGFGPVGDFGDILAVPQKRKSELDGIYGEKAAEGRQRKNSLERNLSKKQQELEEWKSQKDPVPTREKGVEENRKRLIDAGIPHLPLYLAVDFLPEVDTLLRTNIEEALADMGILDALIIPKAYREKALRVEGAEKDRYIFPQARFFKQDLSLFMKPSIHEGGEISYELIDDVLKSIVVDDSEENAYIGENGIYTMGILRGKVSGAQEPRFLGVQARRKYRHENINRIELELQGLKEELEVEATKLKELDNIREILHAEMNNFPSKEDLVLAYNMLVSAGLELEQKNRELSYKENSAEGSYKELKAAREKVRETTSKLGIPLSVDAFIEAESTIEDYRDKLIQVETNHVKLIKFKEQKTSLANQLEDLYADADGLDFDIKKLQREGMDKEEKLKNFNELLGKEDFKEISQQMDYCIRRMREIPAERDELIKRITANEQDILARRERLESIIKKLERQKLIKGLCEGSFKEELKLGYINGNIDIEAPIDLTAKKLYNELKADEKGGNRIRDDFGKILQDSYHQNRASLTEYNLKLDYIFDKETEFFEDTEINNIKNRRKRLDLTARVNGKDVSFKVLQDYIEQSVEENEKLLKESDRQLFEDILANTVGKKIRAKIYHGNEWVKKMNGLMESMNTSSGLSFSLS
ncbi:MAG: TIGR02680 family protein [Clostridia bacterium]